MADVKAMRDFWKRNGPPPNIALLFVAKGLGYDLLKAGAQEESGEAIMSDPKPEQTVEEIANAIPTVVPGGDTMAASREAMRLMGGG